MQNHLYHIRKKDTREARGERYTVPSNLNRYHTDYIVVGHTSSDLQRDTGTYVRIHTYMLSEGMLGQLFALPCVVLC